MHRVQEHIDRNLDQPFELEDIARVANFSSFHFHRLFSAWMGETLGEYLRRRRLEVAAQRLAGQPRLPVTQVALGVGFGSNEAFARAFKARFALTPTAWRAAERARRLSNQRQIAIRISHTAARIRLAAAEQRSMKPQEISFRRQRCSKSNWSTESPSQSHICGT